MITQRFEQQMKISQRRPQQQDLLYNQQQQFRMNTVKGKCIENYQLEKLKFVNQHLSQIWLGKHKILKKNYMVKKVKFQMRIDRNGQALNDGDQKIALSSNKINKEVDILKKLKLACFPKCQKIIKTNNNVYLVFDEFQGKSLSEYFKTHSANYKEKSDSFSKQTMYSNCLEVFLILARSLQNLHKLGVVLLLLSAQNIFVQENKTILFTQSSSIIYNGDDSLVFPLSLANGKDLIAYEALSQSRCSKASDVFSLGKIFDEVLKQQEFKDLLGKMRAIINKMIDKKDSLRPQLQDVISLIMGIEKDLQVKVKSSKLSRMASTGVIYNTQSTLSQQKNKNSVIQNFRQKSKSRISFLEKKSSLSKMSQPFDSLITGVSRTLTMSALSRMRKTNDSFARKINKVRNLSYLLMQLSSFAIQCDKGEELGYILLKQSYIMLNSCYSDWIKEDFQDQKSQIMKNLLKKEIIQHSLTLNMLKEYLKPKKISPQLLLQFKNDTLLNEKYVKETTIQFGKTVISEYNSMVSENRVQSLNNLIDGLFATYMILKKIQEGSYERYWNKVYYNDAAFLKNQSYFKQQKKLGYRYLRSKIEEILKNN